MTATQFFDQLPTLYIKWHFIGSGLCAIIELAIWAYQAYKRPAIYLKSYKLKDIILSSLISTWIGVLVYATDLIYYIDRFLYNRYLKDTIYDRFLRKLTHTNPN